MEVPERNDVIASGPKHQPQDEILEPVGIHPLLIPHVIQAVLGSKRLSVEDLKTCRLVCANWFIPATSFLSKKCRITIDSCSEMSRFIETFNAGQDIPSRDFKLVEYWNSGDIEDFLTDFAPLFDWPGLKIQSLILNNNDGHDGPNRYPGWYYQIGNFVDGLSTLLKKTGNLKHLTFQYWTFKFKFYENLNELEEVLENGSKIKSLSLHNCILPDTAARVMLPTFNKAFPVLESIDFSNLDENKASFCTNIGAETLVRSFNWSNIKSLKISALNTKVIDLLNGTDIKLKHFHADVMWTRKTSTVSWTEFLTQQNELESFSRNKLNTRGDGYGRKGYKLPRMEKLNRLHIGENGIKCLIERNQILESCPKLRELIMGCLPADMVFTNRQISSLTLINTDVFYKDWLEELPRVSTDYVGLKYLTVKLDNPWIKDYVLGSVSNIFPKLAGVEHCSVSSWLVLVTMVNKCVI